MDLTQIIEKNKVGFHSFGNDELYDCFYSLFDDNIQQFEASIKKNFGRKVLYSRVTKLYQFTINTDYDSTSDLIKKNIDLLTTLFNEGHDISQYLTNVKNKLKIFKNFLRSFLHSEFLSKPLSYGKSFEYENNYLVKKLDENLLKLEQISQSKPAPKNDLFGNRSAIYGSQLSSDYYLSVRDDEIPPPPPRPVSHYDDQLGGANSGTIQIPHWVYPLNYSYISVPSPILSYPSATSIAEYPSQPSSVSIPVYWQSQQAYPSQSSSVSIPVYSQSQQAYTSQSSPVSIPVYWQSQQAQPYGQHPITQPTWNRAYYSLQNTKSITYQQTPCSLIPIAHQLLYYQKPTQLPSSYPSAPFVSVPQTAFLVTNPSLSFVRATPASVFVPIGFNSLQGMGRRIR